MQLTPALLDAGGAGAMRGRWRSSLAALARRAGMPRGRAGSVATWSPSPTPPRSPASRSRAPGSPAPRSGESFALAARTLPDRPRLLRQPAGRRARLANAEAAIARKVDLYIQYHRARAANAAIAQKLKAAGIPVLAVNHAGARRAALQPRQRGGRAHRRRGAGPVRRRAPGPASRRSPSSSAACRTQPTASRSGARRDRGAAAAACRPRASSTLDTQGNPAQVEPPARARSRRPADDARS